MKSRRRTVVVATALAGAGLAVTAVIATVAPAQAATALKTLAESHSRYFGTAVTAGDITNTAEMNIATAQFDMVTPGNEMKWDATEPGNGSYNFAQGDKILAFAQAHGMRVRGHNLVWHSQLPAWVSSLPLNQVQTAMQNHVTTEATHYKGAVYAWDVINEPFNEDGSLRQDVFYQAMGQGYIATALRAAHAADPNAKLYINDYNIEGVNAKSNGLYSLAQSLLAQGVPLNGIGLESHFIVGQVPSSLLTNMQRFANLGLDVAITELDDRIPLPASTANLNQQATDYGTVVRDCLNVARCVGVSQWGVDDGHSWIPGTFQGYGAATFYDASYQPKPAYNATVQALSGPVPSSSATTGGPTSPPPSSPPASKSPTSSPPASSPPASTGSGCAASYHLENSWPGGFQATVTVTNHGSSSITAWTVRLTLASGQTISSLWSGVNSGTTGAITVRNASYNGSVAAGASTTFGFTATGDGSTTPTGLTCTSP